MIAVSGAEGFVGRALCAHFAALGWRHRRLVRSSAPDACNPSAAETLAETVAVGDLAIADEQRLANALADVTAVVHLAGRAHVLVDRARDPAALYEAANTRATARLATAAERAGVRRFVFASTVKVLGEETPAGHPFTAGTPVAPRDPYARSKVAAEHVLATIGAGGSMAPIVLRLPLVYGPGVKGNFLRLLDGVARRTPLPFGAVANRRDLLFVGNLVELIARALAAPDPPDGTWLVADGEAVATPDLLRRIAVALEVAPRLYPVPVALLETVATLAGRRRQVLRLTRSLEVDAGPLRRRLGNCPYSLDQGLEQTARWWRHRHRI